ncbi:MAG: hypothetical protein HY665_08545 [Chloroflexi bacterium]|nr:hypothetical protein [Chloroflexota bacterium]
MNEGYVIVKCSRCNSTSHVKATMMTDTFLCPVCEEGEVEVQEQPKSILATTPAIPGYETCLLIGSLVKSGKGAISDEKSLIHSQATLSGHNN